TPAKRESCVIGLRQVVTERGQHPVLDGQRVGQGARGRAFAIPGSAIDVGIGCAELHGACRALVEAIPEARLNGPEVAGLTRRLAGRKSGRSWVLRIAAAIEELLSSVTDNVGVAGGGGADGLLEFVAGLSELLIAAIDIEIKLRVGVSLYTDNRLQRLDRIKRAIAIKRHVRTAGRTVAADSLATQCLHFDIKFLRDDRQDGGEAEAAAHRHVIGAWVFGRDNGRTRRNDLIKIWRIG